MTKQIPKTTKNRYPQYLRVLRVLKERGYERVVSSEIAREMGVLSTTVRKDFITDKATSASVLLGFAGPKVNDTKENILELIEFTKYVFCFL